MNSRHPLGRLIASAQEAKGWSERQLEQQAAGRSGLGKSNISKIKNHPIVSIKGDVIKGLAELLSIPEERVARAALESMGFELTGERSTTLAEAVHEEPNLTDKDRRLILALLREMHRDAERPATKPARGLRAVPDEEQLAASKGDERHPGISATENDPGDH